MKKKFLILIAILLICPASFADESDNIAFLTKKGFFDKPKVSCFRNPCEEVKNVLTLQYKYSNSYDIEKLTTLYSDKYLNTDGFDKEIYFELVKKTWDAYPDIKYNIDINKIQINGNIAVAEVTESAYATTKAESGVINEKGLLENTSESIYYLEKINDEWLIISDYIIFEKTLLRYGSAKYMDVNLVAPCQILANRQYTASLKMNAPENSIIIASIGQEKITYPQKTAEEVFRKLPKEGILERVFRANKDNINEYAVASFGITKAEIKENQNLKVYITGLGFIMSRVNVIPKNNYIKKPEEDKELKNKDNNEKKELEEENEETK